MTNTYSSSAFPTYLTSAVPPTGSVTVESMPGAWPGTYPYSLLIDWGLTTQEAVSVTGVSGSGPYVLACTRGIDGTTAQAHAMGAIAVPGVTAQDFAIPAALVASVAAVTAGQLAGGTGSGTVTPVPLPLSLANGGTGQASQAAALTALTGTQAARQYVRSDGTSAALAAIQAADLPALAYASVFSVVFYGAKGDGTTNDSAAIAAAVAAAIAAGGGTVFFPPGTYYLGTGPIFNASAAVNNIRLCGSGRDATTLKANGALTGGTADLIRIVVPTASTYANNIRVEHMTLDCTAQTAGNGMTLQGVSNLSLFDLHILNPFGFGIDWGSAGGATPYVQNVSADLILIEGERNGNDSIGGGGIINGSVSRYACTDSGTQQVAGTASNLTNLTNFTYRGCYASTSNAGISTGAFNTDFGASGVTWEDIYVSGFKYGLVVSSTSSGQASDITIRGLKVATVHANAIYFNTAAGYGIKRFSISECQVDAWDSAGSANAAFQIFGGHKGLITGNQFNTGVTTAYAIRIAGDNGSVSLNPPTYVTLASNDVSGCTFGINPQFTDPTCVLRDNPGYNPIGTVTPAVPGSSGTAVAAQAYDRTFYITAAGTGTTTVAISGGPTVTIPVSMLATVKVPAGQTLTPAWSSAAPAWVVEAD